MPSLPTGTVTFLFTDIEGSTTLLQRLGDRRYAEVLAEHQKLLRDAFAKVNGHEVDTQGDAFLVAFPRARDALGAAVAAQQALMKHAWPDGASLRVRMGLHTGEPLSGETGYVGIDVHRAARIAAAGHGGQILVSDVTYGLVAKDLPDGMILRDLGEHRLKDLAQPHRLFQVLARDLPTDFPTLRSLDAHPHNLPIQLTSFIGRAQEITEVKRLLGGARLVTVTGAGGAGKTRLALQVAADVLEDYPDGVWLAEFAPIADPALVPKTVASALNVPEQPGRDVTKTLVDALRPKALFLVLDNCEHLLAACADLASALIRACPRVRVLATSREGLGVPGETLWRIPSLSVPDTRSLPPSGDLVLYEAVRLFVDRAIATTPGFAVTSENAAAVAQVCQRLDGIPLAIELAAVRVKVLAVEQIATRLDDRFRLLTGGSRMVLPRHQTLRAAIDWSYHLLSETERVLLRRLSVFAGGWTLEAAEAICGGGSVEAANILDLLTSLVEKSLMLAETQREEARYRLLETVRQYALDRLVEQNEDAEVRRRHRDWCLDLAERAAQELQGPGQGAWLERLETEHDNLRAALEWSSLRGEGTEASLRMAGALAWFWRYHGHWEEGRRWLEEAIDRAGDTPSRALARALRGVSNLAFRQGDYARTTSWSERGLEVCHQIGDKEDTPYFLTWLGIVAQVAVGDYERARELWEESLALARTLGDKWLLSLVLTHLGYVASARGDDKQAAALTDESYVLAKQVGDKWLLARVARDEGRIALCLGDHERALMFFRENLIFAKEVGSTRAFDYSLEGLAELSCEQGHYERAARLLGAVEGLSETEFRYGTPHRAPRWQAMRDRHVSSICTALGESGFAAAWAEGRAMTLEQAIEYALAGLSDPHHDP